MRKQPFVARAAAHRCHVALRCEDACNRCHSQNTRMQQKYSEPASIYRVQSTAWQQTLCLVVSFLLGQKHLAVIATNHTDSCYWAGTSSWEANL